MLGASVVPCKSEEGIDELSHVIIITNTGNVDRTQNVKVVIVITFHHAMSSLFSQQFSISSIEKLEKKLKTVLSFYDGYISQYV